MRGKTMKDKSKKSTYSTTFGIDPKKSTYSTTFGVDPSKRIRQIAICKSNNLAAFRAARIVGLKNICAAKYSRRESNPHRWYRKP